MPGVGSDTVTIGSDTVVVGSDTVAVGYGTITIEWIVLLLCLYLGEDQVDAEDRFEDEEAGLCISASAAKPGSRNSNHVRSGTIPRAECPSSHHDVPSGYGKKGNESIEVEELEIATYIPLAVVVPEVRASSRSHRRARVVRESDKKEIEEGEGRENKGSVEPSRDEREEVDGEQSKNSNSSYDSRRAAGPVLAQEKVRLDQFMEKYELSKVGAELMLVGAKFMFKDIPQEGFMAFRGQIRLGVQLPL
ncbi:hypothetical protein GIB67_019266 [Kingdonia uniflora]|uniref:Uncharacterized protein n=1 Tax=Kingdonia uniflora TaxID=39325 RepID=A0A7J7N074_9MAGN|nr:hypothetical protein GIB67_019266 [Kingdonia uniflora]